MYFVHQPNCASPLGEKNPFLRWSSTVSMSFSANSVDFNMWVSKEKCSSFSLTSISIIRSLNLALTFWSNFQRNSFCGLTLSFSSKELGFSVSIVNKLWNSSLFVLLKKVCYVLCGIFFHCLNKNVEEKVTEKITHTKPKNKINHVLQEQKENDSINFFY